MGKSRHGTTTKNNLKFYRKIEKVPICLHMGRILKESFYRLSILALSILLFSCDKMISDFVGSVGKINGGGFSPNTDVTLPETNTPAQLSLSSSNSNLSLLKPQSLVPTGGTPPYTFSVISGIGTVDSSGIIKSDRKGNLRVQVTDSLGATATLDLAVGDNTLLSGYDVRSIKFNTAGDKAVIGLYVVGSPSTYRIFTASTDINNGSVSNMSEVATVAQIPSLRDVCAVAPLINPAGTKLVVALDTSSAGAGTECELWSMDYNGQNAIQISEELTDVSPGCCDERSVEQVSLTADGARVLYVDGEHAGWNDNEKILKIVDIAGTNLRTLHPLVPTDWGVTRYFEAVGQGRVIFNFNKAASPMDYQTYTARLDGSDAGALVPMTQAGGDVDINNQPYFFNSNAKVIFNQTYNGSSQGTIEMANVDGTGKVVIYPGGASQIFILNFDGTTGRVVYYRANTDVNYYIPGGASGTTISGLAGYGTQPLFKVVGSKFYYVTSNGQELHERNLDGTGDVLRSDTTYAGKIRGFYVQPNNDVIYYGDKDTLYSMDLYKSVSGGPITKLNSAPMVGGLSGMFFNRFLSLGASAYYLEICPGPISFSPWSCTVPTSKLTVDVSGVITTTSNSLNYPSGEEILSGAVQSIRMIYDSTGLYLKWFGL